MNNSSIVSLALSDGVPKRAFAAAVVVGTVLNLINQGDVFMAGEALDYFKLSLTYAVPYLVATYGAVTARLCATGKRRETPSDD